MAFLKLLYKNITTINLLFIEGCQFSPSFSQLDKMILCGHFSCHMRSSSMPSLRWCMTCHLLFKYAHTIYTFCITLCRNISPLLPFLYTSLNLVFGSLYVFSINIVDVVIFSKSSVSWEIYLAVGGWEISQKVFLCWKLNPCFATKWRHKDQCYNNVAMRSPTETQVMLRDLLDLLQRERTHFKHQGVRKFNFTYQDTSEL